jgi:hypothetical protein
MSSVLVLSPDLMAVSSISSAARQAGWTAQSIAQPAQVLDKTTADLKLLIIDLAAVQPPLKGLLEQARLLAPGVAVVAFGPHVQADLLQAAQEAGCDRVCTRGEFMRGLATLFDERLET